MRMGYDVPLACHGRVYAGDTGLGSCLSAAGAWVWTGDEGHGPVTRRAYAG